MFVTRNQKYFHYEHVPVHKAVGVSSRLTSAIHSIMSLHGLLDGGEISNMPAESMIS